MPNGELAHFLTLPQPQCSISLLLHCIPRPFCLRGRIRNPLISSKCMLLKIINIIIIQLQFSGSQYQGILQIIKDSEVLRGAHLKKFIQPRRYQVATTSSSSSARDSSTCKRAQSVLRIRMDSNILVGSRSDPDNTYVLICI
jgi:hypothetical protein